MSAISATAEQRPPPPRKDRIVAGGLGLVVAAVAILVLVLLAQRQPQPGYAMPVAVLEVAALCVWLTLEGAALAAHRRQPAAPWLTLLTTLLFVAAYVAIFSYGVLFLVAGVISLLGRLRMRNAQPPKSWRSRAGAGLLLSLGFAPLSLLIGRGLPVGAVGGSLRQRTPLSGALYARPPLSIT